MIKLNRKQFNGSSILMDDEWLSNGRWLINRSLLADNYQFNQGYFEHKMGQTFRAFEPDEDGVTPYVKAGLLEVNGIECKRTEFLAHGDKLLARLYKASDGEVITIQELYDEAISGVTFDKVLYDNKMLKFIVDEKVMAVVLIYQMSLDLTVFKDAKSTDTEETNETPEDEHDEDEPVGQETDEAPDETPEDEPQETEDEFSSQMQAILAA